MLEAQEQRRHIRLPVPAAVNLCGVLSTPDPVRVRVTDISIGGAQLTGPQLNSALSAQPSRLLVHWPDSNASCAVDLVHAGTQPSSAAEGRLGVRFLDTETPFMAGLCRHVAEQHCQSVDRPLVLQKMHDGTALSEIRDPRVIWRVLRHCCRTARTLHVYDQTHRLVGDFRPAGIAPDQIQGLLYRLPGRLPALGSTSVLLLPLFTGVHIFPTSVTKMDGNAAGFGLPASAFRGAFRHHPRTPLARGDVRLLLSHPFVSDRQLDKALLEIGPAGVSFELDPSHDLLAPGMHIAEAQLALPGGSLIGCALTVRHISRGCDDRLTCGVELTEISPCARDEWLRAVFHAQRPHVEAVQSMASVRDSWTVLDRSGYLDEKPRERMLPAESAYLDVWPAVIGEGQGQLWMTSDRDGPVGTVATTRIFANVWLAHQLGVDRRKPAESRLLAVGELVAQSAFQWLVSSQADPCILIYLDAHKRFNKTAWFDFFDTHQAPHDLDHRRFGLRDYLVSTLSDARQPEDVQDADEGELVTISADLLRREGSLAHRLLCYSPGAIRLEGLPASLARSRRVLVRRRGSQILGYALLDSGAAGLNIFALFDICRVIVLEDEQEGMIATRDALFAGAAAHYRDCGQRSFLYLHEPGDPPPPETNDCFTAEAVRALVRGPALAALIRHLNDLCTLR